MKSGTDKAVEFLKGQGIKADDIKTQSANITEEFEMIREDKVLPGTTVPLRTETSTEGNNDTSSYEKVIITIVRAEYVVK